MSRLTFRKLRPGQLEKLLAAGRQDEALTEESWRFRVRELARLGGWDRQYHTLRSRGSDHGWPDEVFSREVPPRVVFLEIKRDGEHLTVEQYHQLQLLRAAGHDAYALWFPSQYEDAKRLLLYGEPLED